LCKAYRKFGAVKGNIGTYLNFRIRYRPIDLIRKKRREEEQAEVIRLHGLTEIENVFADTVKYWGQSVRKNYEIETSETNVKTPYQYIYLYDLHNK